jgi:hypothetical protein
MHPIGLTHRAISRKGGKGLKLHIPNKYRYEGHGNTHIRRLPELYHSMCLIVNMSISNSVRMSYEDLGSWLVPGGV